MVVDLFTTTFNFMYTLDDVLNSHFYENQKHSQGYIHIELNNGEKHTHEMFFQNGLKTFLPEHWEKHLDYKVTESHLVII